MSYRSYVRMGAVLPMSFPREFSPGGSPAGAMRLLAADPFFSVAELGFIPAAADREAVGKVARESGMLLQYSGHSLLLANGLSLNDPDRENRGRAVAEMKKAIDQAVEMNALSCSFLSGPFAYGQEKQHLDRLVDSTLELCGYASRLALPLRLEVFDYDLDKRSLLGPVTLVREYAERVCRDFPEFGIMVDLSHLPQLRENPAQAILPIREHVKSIHIGNAVVRSPELEAYGDLHPRFGFPGGENGLPELVEFLRVLVEIGYIAKGGGRVIAFEVKPRDYEDPELVLANGKRIFLDAWEQIEGLLP